MKHVTTATALAICAFAAVAGTPGGVLPAAGVVTDRAVSEVIPGRSTKSQVESKLGKPLRIVQFTDCGHSTAQPGQTDETWDYRGKNADGAYRLHIEFGDDGIATLIAKIPEHSDGKGYAAQVAPGAKHHAMADMTM